MSNNRSRGVYLIPNLLTTGNLFSGFYAIIAVYNSHHVAAATAILIAMIFDVLDGRWARLTRTSSRFGLEYDSLADIVSFGVAPGLLIYSWALKGYGRLGWVAAFLILACGALRLARYNVESSSSDGGDFKGLPTPGAAGVIASLVLMDDQFLQLGREVKPLLIVALIYILAFLMVSNFRYSKFKDLKLLQRKPFATLVAAVLFLVVLAAQPYIMLFVLFGFYAVSGPLTQPVGWAIGGLRRKFRDRPAGEHPSDASS